VSKYRTEPLLPPAAPPSEALAETPAKAAEHEPAGAHPAAPELFTQPLSSPVGVTLARPRSGDPLSYRPTELDAHATVATRTPRTAARQALTGRILAGKYELTTRLGLGGMGEVYRAVHRSLGVEVAVKIMHPQVAAVDEYVRRFRREAYAASMLQHRNVVRVFDFGEDQGLLFIVMEYLRGEPMNGWLSHPPSPPPLEKCAELLAQVLDAFDAAHTAGIVHRDLKPENVFITVEDDGQRVAKVVDFGLAHVEDYRDAGPTLTKGDIVSGTPEYMSPEQCRSLAVGASTDIYAIGCLLTEMLQLAPPFTGNPVEVMTQQMFVPPPPLKRPPGAEPVPPLLERLRLSLLAKAPEHRPRDMREIKRLLTEAMSQEATALRLPSRKGEDAQRRGEARSVPPSAPASDPPVSGAMTVGLVRLARRDDGLTTSSVTGLAAQAITMVEAAGNELPPGQVLVLDAGDDLDAATAWLRQKSLGGPVLVCLANVTTERMNALIAAGAKDIVPYPVTSDILARKIRRAGRVK
jgi:serine/threonine protein kinase